MQKQEKGTSQHPDLPRLMGMPLYDERTGNVTQEDFRENSFIQIVVHTHSQQGTDEGNGKDVSIATSLTLHQPSSHR